MTAPPLLAGIELGGTKAIALLARDREIVAQASVPTTTPEATLAAIENWLVAAKAAHGDFAALGIASFGPLGLRRDGEGHGGITATPKPGWSGTPLLSRFAALGVPMALDTDVNAAALAEGQWGGAIGCDTHAYLTIGTGVGAGIVAHGQPLHGLVHPEFGHVRVRRLPGDDFAGSCPFHGDCLEGLISGPALARRAGGDPARLPVDHPLWARVAADLAEALALLLLIASPQRILIGGGVGIGQAQLLPMVRAGVAERLAGYLGPAAARDDLIATATLGAAAGPLGAIALARQAARQRSSG